MPPVLPRCTGLIASGGRGGPNATWWVWAGIFMLKRNWRAWPGRGSTMTGRGRNGCHARILWAAWPRGSIWPATVCASWVPTGPRSAADLRRLSRLARFSGGIWRAFPWPSEWIRRLPGDTVVCRCEGITADDLRDAVSHGGPEANRAKSLGRVGMGRCQGRFCQLAGAELVAAQPGLPPEPVGRLRDQPPVRPAPIAAMIAE